MEGRRRGRGKLRCVCGGEEERERYAEVCVWRGGGEGEVN